MDTCPICETGTITVRAAVAHRGWDGWLLQCQNPRCAREFFCRELPETTVDEIVILGPESVQKRLEVLRG